jgi:hypothetical protein
MLRGLGAALHGDSRRLVQNEEVVVLVERDRGEEGAVGLGERVLGLRRRGHVGERRNSDGLARSEPRARLGAAAIHPHLAGAQELLEPAMRQRGVMGPEPAIEPHAVFALGDGAGLDRRPLPLSGLRRPR